MFDTCPKGCDGNNVGSCFVAGLRYTQGTGVAVDKARATQLYVKDSYGNNANSCSLADLRYDKGVAIDQARATKLLKQAGALGEKDAC